MALVDTIYIKGEKAPLYGSYTAPVGTITISTSPTFSLFDDTGTVVPAFSNVNVSSYDSSTGTLAQAYYDLDTAALAIGYYYGVMTFPIMASDNIVRNRIIDFDIFVRAPGGI